VANGESLILESRNAASDPPDPSDAASLPYGYVVLGGLRRDAGGRIVRFHEWFVQCGPPPPQRRHKAHDAIRGSATRHPFPGLTIRGANCEATDAPSVRHAADASRAFGSMAARWIRDGDP